MRALSTPLANTERCRRDRTGSTDSADNPEPGAFVASQFSAMLVFPLLAVLPVRCDQLDSRVVTMDSADSSWQKLDTMPASSLSACFEAG